MNATDRVLIQVRKKYCTLTFQLLTQYASGKKWSYIRQEMQRYQKQYKNLPDGTVYELYERLKKINIQLASLWWRYSWDLGATVGNTETKRQSDSGYINQLKDMISSFDRTLAVTLFPLASPEEIKPEHPHLVELEFIEIFFPINVLLIAKFRTMASGLGLDIWKAMNLLRRAKIDLLPQLKQLYQTADKSYGYRGNFREDVLDVIRKTLAEAQRLGLRHPMKEAFTKTLSPMTRYSFRDELMQQLPGQYHAYLREAYQKKLVNDLITKLRDRGIDLHDLLPKYQQLPGYRNIGQCLAQLDQADIFGDGILYLAEIPLSTATSRGRVDQLILFNLSGLSGGKKRADDLPVLMATMERKTKGRLAFNIHKFATQKDTSKFALGIHSAFKGLDREDLVGFAHNYLSDTSIREQLNGYTDTVIDELIGQLGPVLPGYAELYRDHRPLHLVSIIDASCTAEEVAKQELQLLHSFLRSLRDEATTTRLREPRVISSDSCADVIILAFPSSSPLLSCRSYPISSMITASPSAPPELESSVSLVPSMKTGSSSQEIHLHYMVPSAHQSGLKAAMISSLRYLLDRLDHQTSAIVDLTGAAVGNWIWGIDSPITVVSVDWLTTPINEIRTFEDRLSQYTSVIVLGAHLLRSYRWRVMSTLETIFVEMTTATIHWVDVAPRGIGFSRTYWDHRLRPCYSTSSVIYQRHTSITWNIPTPIHSARNLQPRNNTQRVFILHDSMDATEVSTASYPELERISMDYQQPSRYSNLKFDPLPVDELRSAAMRLLPWLREDDRKFSRVDFDISPVLPYMTEPRLVFDPGLPAHGNLNALPVSGTDDLYAFTPRSDRSFRQDRVSSIYDPPYRFELTAPEWDDLAVFYSRILITEIKLLRKVCRHLLDDCEPTSKQEDDPSTLVGFLSLLSENLDTVEQPQSLRTVNQMIRKLCQRYGQSFVIFEQFLYRVRIELHDQFPGLDIDIPVGLWLCLAVCINQLEYSVTPNDLRTVLSRYSTWVLYKLGYSIDRDNYIYSLTHILRRIRSDVDLIAETEQDSGETVLADLEEIIPLRIYIYPNRYLLLVGTIPPSYMVLDRKASIDELFHASKLYPSRYDLLQLDLQDVDLELHGFLSQGGSDYLLYIDDTRAYQCLTRLRFSINRCKKQLQAISAVTLFDHPGDSLPQSFPVPDRDWKAIIESLAILQDETNYLFCRIRVVQNNTEFIAELHQASIEADGHDIDTMLDQYGQPKVYDLVMFLRAELHDTGRFHYMWSRFHIVYDTPELQLLERFVNMPYSQLWHYLKRFGQLPVFGTATELQLIEDEEMPVKVIPVDVHHKVKWCRNLHLVNLKEPRELEDYSSQEAEGKVHDLCIAIDGDLDVIRDYLGLQGTKPYQISPEQLYHLYLFSKFMDSYDGTIYDVQLQVDRSTWPVFREHPKLIKIYREEKRRPTTHMLCFGSFAAKYTIKIEKHELENIRLVLIIYNMLWDSHKTESISEFTRCDFIARLEKCFDGTDPDCLDLDWDRLSNPGYIDFIRIDVVDKIKRHHNSCDCASVGTNSSGAVARGSQPSDEQVVVYKSLEIEEDNDSYRLRINFENNPPCTADNLDRDELVASLRDVICDHMFADQFYLDPEVTIEGDPDQLVSDSSIELLYYTEPGEEQQYQKLIDRYTYLLGLVEELESRVGGRLNPAREVCAKLFQKLLCNVPGTPTNCIHHDRRCGNRLSHHLLQSFGSELEICGKMIGELVWLDLLEFQNQQEAPLPDNGPLKVSVINQEDVFSNSQKIDLFRELLLQDYPEQDIVGQFQLLYEIGARFIRHDTVLAEAYLRAAKRVYLQEFDDREREEFVYEPKQGRYQLPASLVNLEYNRARLYEVRGNKVNDPIEKHNSFEKSERLYLRLLDKFRSKLEVDDIKLIRKRLATVQFQLAKYKKSLKEIERIIEINQTTKKQSVSTKSFISNLLSKFDLNIYLFNFEQCETIKKKIEREYYHFLEENSQIRSKYKLLLLDFYIISGKFDLANQFSSDLLIETKYNHIKAYVLRRIIQIGLIRNENTDIYQTKLLNLKNQSESEYLIHNIDLYQFEIKFLESVLHENFQHAIKLFTSLSNLPIYNRHIINYCTSFLVISMNEKNRHFLSNELNSLITKYNKILSKSNSIIWNLQNPRKFSQNRNNSPNLYNFLSNVISKYKVENEFMAEMILFCKI